MKNKIKLITDFEPKILSNFIEKDINKSKKYIIESDQIINPENIKLSSNYEIVIFFSQLEKILFQFKKLHDSGFVNKNKLDKEIKKILEVIKKLSLTNKKIFFFLWPNDIKDSFFGTLNHKEHGKSWLVNYINLSVSKLLSKYNNVILIDPNFELLKKNKKITIFNYKLKYLIDCYYDYEYLNFASKTLSEKISIENKNNIKLIILDLDNTLWGGLAGELNFDQVKIGPNSVEGQVFLDFQKRLKVLKSMGIILAISSKNDFRNVKKIFTKNKYMFLSLNDFSSIKVNWEPKAKNVETILNELNLKAHHALFIDDSAYERSSVKSHIKNINLFNFPENILDLMDNLNNYEGFNKNLISDLDKTRTKLYQAEARRENEKKKFNNNAKWLRNLKIKLNINKLNDLERATEMFQRTNQFNTSFRRLTMPELLKLKKSKTNLIFEASMKDKFGDYGIISFLNIKIFKQYFIIEDFLMSCRVFKRDIELAILSHIFKLNMLANKKGFMTINRSEKNKYVQDLFDNNNLVELINDKKYEINKDIKKIDIKNLGIKILS